MKRKITILLLTILSLFLFACGKESKEANQKITVEEAIIGKWEYHTGFTTWNFIFNEDMTCSYWSGVSEPEESTYTMENESLIVEGLEWDFYYKLENEELRFWNETLHDDGSRSEWEFTKDTTYNPEEQPSTLFLTDDMLDEIEEKYTSSSMLLQLQILLNASYDEDFEVVDWEVGNAKKTDPYTFVVYGKLYIEDNYGEKYYQNTNITYTAVEDSEEESGYSIERDVDFVD